MKLNGLAEALPNSDVVPACPNIEPVLGLLSLPPMEGAPNIEETAGAALAVLPNIEPDIAGLSAAGLSVGGLAKTIEKKGKLIQFYLATIHPRLTRY